MIGAVLVTVVSGAKGRMECLDKCGVNGEIRKANVNNWNKVGTGIENCLRATLSYPQDQLRTRSRDGVKHLCVLHIDRYSQDL